MSVQKQLYRVKDWKKYNEVLKERWSLDLWLSPQVIEEWYQDKKNPPLTYSGEAILACLTLRALFNLSLRATE